MYPSFKDTSQKLFLPLYWHSIGQNIVTWLHLAEKENGKCSLYSGWLYSQLGKSYITQEEENNGFGRTWVGSAAQLQYHSKCPLLPSHFSGDRRFHINHRTFCMFLEYRTYYPAVQWFIDICESSLSAGTLSNSSPCPPIMFGTTHIKWLVHHYTVRGAARIGTQVAKASMGWGRKGKETTIRSWRAVCKQSLKGIWWKDHSGGQQDRRWGDCLEAVWVTWEMMKTLN